MHMLIISQFSNQKSKKVIKLRVISEIYKLKKKSFFFFTSGFCKTYEVKATTTIVILRWVDDLTRGLVFLGQLHKTRLPNVPNVPLQSPKMNSCQWTRINTT
jgi:hypothetical protein